MLYTMVWTTDPNRDVHGHLGHVQVWTSVAAAGTVHLYFAHRGLLINGHKIEESNNFFYKHILLPSKSGRSVQEKAENRVDRRKGYKQLHRKVAAGQAAGKAWAQPTVDFATQFVANLGNAAYVAALGGVAAVWTAMQPQMQQALQALPPGSTDAAKSAAIRKVIGTAQKANAKTYADAFKNADDPATRAGIGWADKYGEILTSDNTTVVLNDGAAATWVAPTGIIPISRQAAADKFYAALLPQANAAAAFPANVAATVNFGQVCVLTVSKTNQAAAWANASTMKIRARIISPLYYDVYHYDP